MPDPTGVGRPYMVQTSGHVDPNSWWWVLGSDAGADVLLYLVEPVFLQLQVVHHVLEMGVGAGMIGG